MLNLTYNEILGAYGVYPAPIRPYLLRAETHPTIREMLTKSFMRVFIDLLARAPIADPQRPIMLRVDTVAEQLDVSRKTVSRALNTFINLGWLCPFEGHDGRTRWGKFCGRKYVLQLPIRELVGLPLEKHSPKVPANGSVNNAAQSKASSEPAYDQGDSANEPKMSHGHMVNKVLNKKEASFKEGASKNQKLPADLQALHDELGISIFGICSLMGLAKRVKQRLQDVWIAKQTQIRNAGAKGGRAFEYFKYLLNCGEDFAYVARTRGAIQAVAVSPTSPAISQSTVDDQLRSIAQACKFKRFKHVRNGMEVRFFDGTAEVSRDNQVAYYAAEQMLGLYKGIANGNLVEVVL